MYAILTNGTNMTIYTPRPSDESGASRTLTVPQHRIQNGPCATITKGSGTGRLAHLGRNSLKRLEMVVHRLHERCMKSNRPEKLGRNDIKDKKEICDAMEYIENRKRQIVGCNVRKQAPRREDKEPTSDCESAKICARRD